MIPVLLRIRYHRYRNIPTPVTLALLFGCLIYTLLPIFRYFRYRRTVTGRIAELAEDNGNRHKNRITAEYTVDGSTYYVRSTFGHNIPYYKTGIEISVRVSEKNPAHAMLPHDLRTAVISSLLTGAAFAFVLVVAVI